MKRYQDAKWTRAMALTLDYNYAMADFVGVQNGLRSEELDELTTRIQEIDQDLKTRRQQGKLAFYELPYRQETITEVKNLAKPLLEWFWDFIVLGIGGSALGARALHQALCHPQHNLLALARRHHRPRLLVADNIDPDGFYGLLDAVDLRRTVFNVISKSGSTAETLSQFLFVYGMLKGRLGEARARDRVILTTDPEQGNLRRLAQSEGFRSLTIPPKVGGRFSIFSAVGMFPAEMVGIDIDELMAGARFMDVCLKEPEFKNNLAYRLAAIYYLFYTRKNRPIQVLMPYASSLSGVAEWFCQIWAESLGKKFNLQGQIVNVGPTPVRALGATDQHSQLQLYIEGPFDKVITFLEVENFQHHVALPSLYPELEGLSYLGGHTLNELIKAEKTATAFNLMRNGRPNLTIRLPEINAFTIGQLLFLFEVMTVSLGGLLGVNPLDQPGVEGGKHTTYGLMGRPGFEEYRQQLESAPPLREQYQII
ncbi:MAG: glucose-6-phosphate isomerase [Deltaproteobacteria bacterium]|nr:glucose-6-phosphate isomerase [Deltaproteobacteria bacterium]MBW1952550.1 glucose-6-phosphate isomerase [Deltaproteobacteria bacterium]MBW1986113.1 glucose-6-phosphate isomerase [Deltaproteobacteria bacterium]MBW2134201.1 glucose-6-phosphate isomerase [Deltaproteobacteria bacterium]